MTEKTINGIQLPDSYAPSLYYAFVKSVIVNFPNVSYASHGKNKDLEYLKVIQSGEEFKFEYIDIQPHKKIDDLKTLEDRLFLTLKD